LFILTKKCVHFRRERWSNRAFPWFRWTKYCKRQTKLSDKSPDSLFLLIRVPLSLRCARKRLQPRGTQRNIHTCVVSYNAVGCIVRLARHNSAIRYYCYFFFISVCCRFMDFHQSECMIYWDMCSMRCKIWMFELVDYYWKNKLKICHYDRRALFY